VGVFVRKGALQPAVFRSVKFMLRDGVLVKSTLFAGRKEVTLTDKGMAIAILAGIKHKKLTEFLTKSEGFKNESDKEQHRLLQTIMLLGRRYWPAKEDYVLQTALEYMVIQEWFEKEKETLTKEDRIHLFIFLIPYILTHVEDVKDIVELINKFGIDKIKFGELLLDRVNSSVEALNEYRRYAEIPYLIESPERAKVFLKNVEEMIAPRQLQILESEAESIEKPLRSVEEEKVSNTDIMKIADSVEEDIAINELRKLVNLSTFDQLYDLVRRSGSSLIIPEKTLDMTIKDLDKHYAGCTICSKYLSEFPKYIINHPNGTNEFKEPKVKNRKLFLDLLKGFRQHFGAGHFDEETKWYFHGETEGTLVTKAPRTSKYERLFEIINDRKEPNKRYEAAEIIMKNIQEMKSLEQDKNTQRRWARILNMMNKIMKRYNDTISPKERNNAMNEFYKIIMKDFRPELERIYAVIDTIKE